MGVASRAKRDQLPEQLVQRDLLEVLQGVTQVRHVALQFILACLVLTNYCNQRHDLLMVVSRSCPAYLIVWARWAELNFVVAMLPELLHANICTGCIENNQLTIIHRQCRNPFLPLMARTGAAERRAAVRVQGAAKACTGKQQ